MSENDKRDADSIEGIDLVESAERCRQRGNKRYARDDYAEACACYEEGLKHLYKVVKDDGKSQDAEDPRLALHLNAAMSYLRRGGPHDSENYFTADLPALTSIQARSLLSAEEHATRVLAIAPQHINGLYRRGSARFMYWVLAGAERYASLAEADYVAALEQRPESAEIRKKLSTLRKRMDDITNHPAKLPGERPGGVDADRDSRRWVLSVNGVTFRFMGAAEPVLRDVNLDVRAGQCVGLCGAAASGKTTLGRLLAGQLLPSAGRIAHHGRALPAPPGATVSFTAWFLVVAGAVVSLAAAVGGAKPPAELDAVHGAARVARQHSLAAVLCAVCAAIALKVALDRRARRRSRHVVVLLTSDHFRGKERIPPKMTAEDAVAALLPRQLKPHEHRERVNAMFRAAGLVSLGDDAERQLMLPYGQLSGGRKHVVHVLRAIAKKPDVLICDEVLHGLDVAVRPRLLRMLCRMKDELGTSIVYMATEAREIRLIADTVLLLSGRRVRTLRDSEEFPASAKEEQKEGVSDCDTIDELAKNFGDLAMDTCLAGNWLPA